MLAASVADDFLHQPITSLELSDLSLATVFAARSRAMVTGQNNIMVEQIKIQDRDGFDGLMALLMDERH